ncbi:MAG: preprotein translocase subunit YajC [Candidatus Marinimicrobia bacterium]|nr:preprotein translocase subunit YajC [Candidatus Neomarinimicrobiota bacterium]
MGILIAGQAGGQGGAGGILSMLPLMVIMFLIMYFIIIRPQKKQQKQFEDMLANLKKGDKILTKGGIYCTIVEFIGKEGHKVLAECEGGKSKIQISRAYISAVISRDTSKVKNED